MVCLTGAVNDPLNCFTSCITQGSVQETKSTSDILDRKGLTTGNQVLYEIIGRLKEFKKTL